MITSFRDEYAFLSNFYPSKVVCDGLMFETVEHAYQAYKTLDMVERRKIAMLPTPGQAKRYWKDRRFRYDWDNRKLEIMERLLRRKFRIPELRKKLLSTVGSDLVEGNTWGDKFWGCVYEKGKWVGENHLGKLLMQIREEMS